MRQDLTHILRWIRPGASVLDLGCADGEFLALLREQRDARVLGIEIDADAGATIDPSTFTISGNQISGNATAGLNNANAIAVTAESNWWGDAKGPGPVGPGDVLLGDRRRWDADNGDLPWKTESGSQASSQKRPLCGLLF